jgi:hypothetical protein
MNLQIFRNLQNFEEVILNKGSSKAQGLEYLRKGEGVVRVSIITSIKFELSQGSHIRCRAEYKKIPKI